jgi:hypothetical protein
MAAAFSSVTCTDSFDFIPVTKNGNSTNFLLIDGDTMRITNFRTISSSSTPGYLGEVCIDANYIYVCVAEDTWRRSALQSF